MTDELHIRLLYFDIVTIDRAWRKNSLNSSYWRLYLNNRPGASIVMGDELYDIPAGHVFFIPPWIPCHGQTDQPIRHFHVHFDVLGLSGWMIRELFRRPFATKTRLDFDSQVVDDIFQQRNLVSLSRIKSLIHSELADMLQTLPSEQFEKISRSTQGLGRFGTALTYIEHNLCEPLGNAVLAEVAHVSESHFIRRFQEITGTTPAKYVMERRVASAARDLILSGESIEQIAENHGFTNRFHFSRVFKNYMGIPPATYRKSNRF